ncbi:MAG: ATP-binding protein [Oscillospiraceae bacterium]|nr:ATP-binding protein [Oscillospiraceae bacterium]
MKPDEYLNSDGLIYCKNCCTPRQLKIIVYGKERTVPINCRCQHAEIEKQRQKEKERDFQNYVRSLKSTGLSDKRFSEYTFENDKGYNPEIAKAKTYVNRWKKMKEKNLGLLIWGDVGTGKTFFAGCIANALIEKGIPVVMTNFSKIINTLTGIFSEERNRYLESLAKCELLIIDDLGIERNSEFALEQVFSVIDSRYRSKKPLIVTTNLTLDEIQNPENLAKARIYDRILELCVPVKINNVNIRKQNATEKLKELRNIFESGA